MGAAEPGTGVRAHGRVVVLFRAALGLVFLAAFLSLSVQLRDLIGSHGLLPLHPYLEQVRGALPDLFERLHSVPTLFWLADSDAWLRVLPLCGAALSLSLVAGFGGRPIVALLWALYLSCIVAGRDFFYYQWDNLLLEASFLAIALPGSGRTIDLAGRSDGRRVPEPSPVVVYLLRWLLFRLLFESLLAKVIYGPDDWLTLRAMTYYYETAPLPSWGGWLVQQLPLWFHQASAVITLLAEGLLPFLIFAPSRRLRVAFVLLHAGFQSSIAFTSNYGWFNLLAVALSLMVLEDGDIGWLKGLLRRGARAHGGAAEKEAGSIPGPSAHPRPGAARMAPWALAAFIVPASTVEGWGYFDRQATEEGPVVRAFRRAYAPFRSVNVYHLFPGVVRQRIVAEIEGSEDGAVWSPIHLRDAPGDPSRRPPTTGLHNPRLPFTYSFFTLGRGGRDSEYIRNLADRLCCEPEAVRSLTEASPFHDRRPKLLRLTLYRYRFGTWADLRRDGIYWKRELVRPPAAPVACSCRSGP